VVPSGVATKPTHFDDLVVEECELVDAEVEDVRASWV
jgi:hypothetical protein